MPSGVANSEPQDQQRNLPDFCEIRDWPVFVDGYHKGQLYPDAELERMEQNFQLLSAPNAKFKAEDGGPYLTAHAKLGHDKQQRAKQSLGFTNLGKIVALQRGGPNGTARLWLTNVPTEIGAKINAGLIDGGSIEVIPELPNPISPAEKIRGPIITGVAFLGEEQPAVKGMGRPVALFADGTPVPPDYRVERWLNAFAEAAKEPDKAPEDAREFAAFSDKFAAVNKLAPVESKAMADPKKMFAAKFAAKFAGGPEPGSDAFKAMKAKEDPNYTWYDDKDYSANFSAFTSRFASACKKYAAGADEKEIEKESPGFSAAFSTFTNKFGMDDVMPAAGAPAAMAGAPAMAPPPANPPAMPPDSGTMSYADLAKKFTEDPNATPEQKMMAAMATKLGALEAAKSDEQAKNAEMSAKAFSADLDFKLNGRWENNDLITDHRQLPLKVSAVDRDQIKATLITLYGPQVKTFANDSDRLAGLSSILDGLAKKPIDKQLVGAKPNATPPIDPATGKPLAAPQRHYTAGQLAMINGPLKQVMPVLQERVLGKVS